jgi:iron complex outermembrane recepter protein
MKKKIILVSFLLLQVAAVLHAQAPNSNATELTGTILSNKVAIENTVVLLLKSADSSIAKTATTNKTGQFSFSNFVSGTYIVSIQSFTHQKYFSQPVVVTTASIDLGNIELIAIKKQLEKVTVVGNKPMIEVKADKIVVNVEANTSNVGANALEVLQKSPGVTVDKDGNISLKGNASVVIYMDGRPTYLSGADLSTMLTNMQSTQLESIEIMTNPSSKYDAAGNAGIINIKTKKSKVFGFNGSVTLTAGIGMQYPRFGETVNVNYRKNKFNIFGSFNHNYRESFQMLSIDRKFVNASTNEVSSYFSQRNDIIKTNKDYSAKFGVDYNLSKKTTLGAVIKQSYSPSATTAGGNILLKNNVNILDSTTLSESLNDVTWQNFSTNLNLRHVFDSTGKELTVDVDYITYNANNDMKLTSNYYKLGLPSSKADTLFGNLPQNIKIYSAKADYNMPINKTLNFEAGLKASYVVTNANAKYDSVINGKIINAITRTNFFKYDESISAAYVNLNKKFSEKLSIQGGLRFENTHLKGRELTTNKTFERNYAQLFPTAYIQYSPFKKHSFVLNYGRRITRPNYESLNPFVEYLDKYTFEEGNPFLQPQFSHNIELTHTYNNFLNTTLNYTTTNNIIQQVFLTNPSKTETAIKLDNIASSKTLGLSVNAFLPIQKWFTSNVYVIGNYNEFKGLINNKLISQNFSRFAVNVDNQFKFNKGWSANLSGFYTTGEIDGVIIINPLYSIDLGVGKTILKKKGSLRFSLKDVFFSQKASGYTKYDNVDIQFSQLRNSRVFNLAFTYRFNKGSLKAASQRKTGGADEEQQRVSNN